MDIAEKRRERVCCPVELKEAIRLLPKLRPDADTAAVVCMLSNCTEKTNTAQVVLSPKAAC